MMHQVNMYSKWEMTHTRSTSFTSINAFQIALNLLQIASVWKISCPTKKVCCKSKILIHNMMYTCFTYDVNIIDILMRNCIYIGDNWCILRLAFRFIHMMKWCLLYGLYTIPVHATANITGSLKLDELCTLLLRMHAVIFGHFSCMYMTHYHAQVKGYMLILSKF